MSVLWLTLAIAGTLAIFATTRSGRALLAHTRLRDRIPGAANTRDVRYLLDACEGDRRRVERLLSVERERYPDLSEAEHYRRAIRKILRARSSDPD